MSVTWYCFFDHGDSTRTLSDADRRKAVDAVRGSPHFQAAYVHTPSSAPHPHADGDVAPLLALELEFANVTDCERALRHDTRLGRLADPGFVPSLAGSTVSQQGMLRRSYAVADPGNGSATGLCTYLVHYPGPAEDERAWLDHYLVRHAPLVADLPGVRTVTVDTPAVIASGLPFRFSGALLRNKAVFDSAEALSVALSSPGRDALRADAAAFPEFVGGSVHVPMETLVVPRRDFSGRQTGLDPFHLAPSNS